MQAILGNIPCGFKKINLPLPSEIYQRCPDTKEDTFVVKFARPLFLMVSRRSKARLARVLLATINGKRLLLIYAQDKKQGRNRQTRTGYCLQLSTAIGISISRKGMKSTISNYIGQGELHCLIEVKFKFGTAIFELDGERRISEWCSRILKSYEPALLPDRQLMFQQDQMEMVEHYSSSPVQQSSSAELSTSTAVQPDEEEQSNRTKEGWCTLGELNMTQTDNEEEDEHSKKEEEDGIYENITDLFNNSSMTSAAGSVKTLFVPRKKKKGGRHHQQRNAKNKKNQPSQSSQEDIGAPLASSSLAEPSSLTGTSEMSDSSTQNGRRQYKWTPNNGRGRRQTIVIDWQQQQQPPPQPATLSQGYSRLVNSPAPRERANHQCDPMYYTVPVKKQVRWQTSTVPPPLPPPPPLPTRQFVPRPIIPPMQQTNSTTFGYIVQRYGFSTSDTMENNGGRPAGTINDEMLNVKRLFEERINKFLKENPSQASTTSSTLKMPQPKRQQPMGPTYAAAASCWPSPATAQLDARGGLGRPTQLNQPSESNA